MVRYITLFVLLLAGICAAVVTPVWADVESITITPSDVTVNLHFDTVTTQQFTVTATHDDGTTEDVTGDVSWESTVETVATIDTAGLAQALDMGETTITATLDLPGGGEVSGAAQLAVIKVVSLAIDPDNVTVNYDLDADTTVQYTAYAVHSDNSLRDMTQTVTWDSSLLGVARIDHNGLAETFRAGQAIISASLTLPDATNVTTQAMLEVVEIQDFSVIPDSDTVNLDLDSDTTRQLVAEATLTNDEKLDVTDRVNWTTSDTSIATISSTGLVEGVDVGNVTISSTLTVNDGSEFKNEPAITVVNVDSVEVTPANDVLIDLDVDPETAVQYTAMATMNDDSTMNVTGLVEWSSTEETVASIDSSGLAQALDVGETEIHAVLKRNDGTDIEEIVRQLAVRNVAALSFTPEDAAINLDMAPDKTIQYTATATFSDDETENVTTSVEWSSSNTAVASIDSQGLAEAREYGTTRIKASLKRPDGSVAKETTSDLKVIQVKKLEIIPSEVTVNLDLDSNTSVQFTAMVTFTDDSTDNVTTSVGWQSINTGVATINDQGLAQASEKGTTTVAATLRRPDGSSVVGETSRIRVVVVEHLKVDPRSATINLSQDAGDAVQVDAIASLTDGTVETINDKVAWTSDAPTVAQVDNGFVQGLATGSALIRASIAGKTFDPDETSAEIEVVEIERFMIVPVEKTANKAFDTGKTVQFASHVVLSDGTTRNVTVESRWTSSDTGVARIYATGLAETVDVGTTTITASLPIGSGSYIKQATLTVIDEDSDIIEPPLDDAFVVDTIATTSGSSKVTIVSPAEGSGITPAGLAVDAHGNRYVSDQGTGAVYGGSIIMIEEGTETSVRIIRDLTNPGDIELSPDERSLHVSDAAGNVHHIVLGASIKITNIDTVDLFSKKTTIYMSTDFGEKIQQVGPDGLFHFLDILVPGQGNRVDLTIEHDGETRAYENYLIGDVGPGGVLSGHGIIELSF